MEDVASALEQLSSPSAGPWQEVSALWRETVRARLRYLYYEEGTLQEYFNKYPILKSSDGWRLLDGENSVGILTAHGRCLKYFKTHFLGIFLF